MAMIFKMAHENTTIVDYDSSTNDYYDVTPYPTTTVDSSAVKMAQTLRVVYIVTYSTDFILGVILNFTVIVVGLQKSKLSNKTADWILALAVTHLASCISVAFQLLYVYNDFAWKYGSVSCKMASYLTYGSMFSSAAMLNLWSLHSILLKSSCIKQYRNCHVTLIAFSWTVAAILACPSLVSREVRDHRCIDDYYFNKEGKSREGKVPMKAVVGMRLLLGLLVPALVMFISFLMGPFKKRCPSCMKKKQILRLFQIVYFVCWGPLILLSMLQITEFNRNGSNMATYWLPFATMLATSHCFISPLFFLLLGCRGDNKMKWMTHDPDQNHRGADSLPGDDLEQLHVAA
ncbi:hypothetical protein DNTS_002255 [Danionella cerebrum]|uniref:G-protein coupled receptors family 1 profile domain-containing protein n=1 Tax=Danionella cerebrum TaxID=2873325 RepID=A0A553P0W0_9TELE|nr:hypothetical protein DNTS_002255 [Danionella translucida]